MPAKVASPTGAPGIQQGQINTNQPVSSGVVSFRRASLMKVEPAQQDTLAFGSPKNSVIEGTGYLCGIDLDIQAVAAGNAAVVAYDPDAPWNVLQSVVLKNVGPDTVNVSGYGLYLANLYGGHGYRDPATSLDTNVYQLLAGVGGGLGGSFRCPLRVPVAINRRSLIGLLGNQDRAVKYELRTDLAPSASVYTVAPTVVPSVVVSKSLAYATVPAPMDDNRRPQEPMPPHYGVIHTLQELQSEANPVASSTINHFLRGIGNTIRCMILVWRDATGARNDTLLPNKITFRVGSDAVFSESAAHRRQVMRDRYGFDAPAGVLVYDFISDFGMDAGFELGDDWLNTRDVANAQFECSYGAFGAAGSLKIITDSLVIPANLDLSAMV
jgi:hypothetical protein